MVEAEAVEAAKAARAAEGSRGKQVKLVLSLHNPLKKLGMGTFFLKMLNPP